MTQMHTIEAIFDGECRYCGRSMPDIEDGSQCPVDDDCPSHFEAVGKHQPDHPDTPLGDPFATGSDQ